MEAVKLWAKGSNNLLSLTAAMLSRSDGSVCGSSHGSSKATGRNQKLLST